MMTVRSLSVSLLLLFVGASPLAAQSRPKVTVIGASLSRGMSLAEEASKRGADWLFAKLPEERKSSIGLGSLVAELGSAVVLDRSDLYLFTDPLHRGEIQIERACGDGAALILALDFLFWFGYWPEEEKLPKAESGSPLLQAYGKSDADLERCLRSLEKQHRGFALIDRLIAKTTAPIVIADYPDMFGANPLMLSPNRIPLRRTLDELNRRLERFAAERPRLLVFPLADYVARSKRGLVSLPEGDGRRVLPDDAIQGDNLHPTRLGTALVLHELLPLLRERLEGEAQRALPAPLAFADLVAKAGAEAHYRALLAAPKPAPAPAASSASK
ncbi:MAG: hypothetical protein IPN34_08915 [Planctomycetes bacterium]|nr:hypothetical protein [Planctomycetota bacterium]